MSFDGQLIKWTSRRPSSCTWRANGAICFSLKAPATSKASLRHFGLDVDKCPQEVDEPFALFQTADEEDVRLAVGKTRDGRCQAIIAETCQVNTVGDNPVVAWEIAGVYSFAASETTIRPSSQPKPVVENAGGHIC